MVKSARRALEILERFEALQRPASVGEIAAGLGYPVSSTSVLLHTLKELGYLSFDPQSRQFAPTVRVGFMGDWILNGHPGRARLKSLLHDARRLTSMTALLATRNGLDAQYLFVLRAQGANFESRLPSMGTIRSILTASPGIMLLSELPDAQIELVVRGVKATQRTSASLERVMQDVGSARRLGYAWNVGPRFPDVGSVSVRLPIDDMFGKPLVMSVAGFGDTIAAEHARIAGVLRRLVGRFRRRVAEHSGAPVRRPGARSSRRTRPPEAVEGPVDSR